MRLAVPSLHYITGQDLRLDSDVYVLHCKKIVVAVASLCL